MILVQIENEYGAYGSDTAYLAELVRVTREAGITVPLTTIDQPTPQMLADGSLPGLHLTGSFGSRAADRLATLREFQPTGPLMCMEFWCGWFDDWGSHHHTTDAAASAAELDALLAAGGSVNVYMFHGGTNFGLTNGANDKGRYAPITTSYDYDAPLDESGHPTEKFWAFRDVIAKYAPVPDEVPARATDRARARRRRSSRGPTLLAVADAPRRRDRVTSACRRSTSSATTAGSRCSRTRIEPRRPGHAHGRRGGARPRVGPLDGVPVGVLARDAHERAVVLPEARGELAIVVEDQGRVDYGTRIGEHKGLIGGVHLDGVELTGWTARPIDLDRVPGARPRERAVEFAAGPLLARGSFELDEAADLFLDTLRLGQGPRVGERVPARAVLATGAAAHAHRAVAGHAGGAQRRRGARVRGDRRPGDPPARRAGARAHRDLSAGRQDCAGTAVG